MSSLWLVTTAAGVLAIGAALQPPSPPRQSPSNVAVGQTIDGISCDAQEGQRLHIHQHLTVLDHGRPIDIPPNVGQPAMKRCIYWLHTHTPDGVIHIEAPLNRSFTLGHFFKIWGEPLSRTRAASARATKGTTLKVWVDGHPFKGDPRSIPLRAWVQRRWLSIRRCQDTAWLQSGFAGVCCWG